MAPDTGNHLLNHYTPQYTLYNEVFTFKVSITIKYYRYIMAPNLYLITHTIKLMCNIFSIIVNTKNHILRDLHYVLLLLYIQYYHTHVETLTLMYHYHIQ